MGEVVIGIGMSHSPMVVTGGDVWQRFGAADRNSEFLRDKAGLRVSFAELAAANGERFATESQPSYLIAQAGTVQSALRRLKADFDAAEVDVVLVFGDDQMELHDLGNLPALGVFYGAELISAIGARFGTYEDDVEMPEFRVGYGQDQHHRWQGHEALGRHLIESLVGDGFDVAAMGKVTPHDGAGIGHAFGIVEVQLLDHGRLPMVPIYLNTYWAPNQLSTRRCWDIGAAVRRAVASYPEDLRVAVVASGGLSHFVTDEDLDRRTLAALRGGSEDDLVGLPEERLNGGNSEIRNWVALAAACRDMRVLWDVYEPVYRTPVGTGCGLTFMRWG